MTFTTRPELVGTFGAVTTTHWLASQTGMAMLERGGNAFDAAVAAAFTLHVAEPHMNGPGGDVPIIFQRHDAESAVVLCGQGPAPAGATIDHYRGEGLDLVPGTGLLAAVVPGATPTWLTLLRDHGTMELADVLAPAIGYAADGCPVHPAVTGTIEPLVSLFRDEWTTSAEVWLSGGEALRAGSIYRNRDLAATYTKLVAEAVGPTREARIDHALAAWSEGFVAEAVDGFAPLAEVYDVTGTRHRGVLTGADMAGWSPRYEAPLTFDYAGLTVNKCGPWSQAPVFLQQLALLSGFDLAAMDPNGADLVHTVVECAKLAFADRETFYGDPDFVDVPFDVLLSPVYNDARRALVGAAASLELRPGDAVGGRVPDFDAAVARIDLARQAAGAAEPTLAGSAQAREGDTCHMDVIDRWGNVVSATPSGGWLQSSPIVPGLGFPLGSRAQMFWLDADHPSGLAPGKRPRTTLTPGLAQRDGRPYLAFGTPGGDQQDQWALALLLRHVHHGMNLQAAIDAPAWHSEHFPSSFWPRFARPGRLILERRFGEATATELTKRGHVVRFTGDWEEGRLCAASRVVDDGGVAVLRAAANPRQMQSYAVAR